MNPTLLPLSPRPVAIRILLVSHDDAEREEWRRAVEPHHFSLMCGDSLNLDVVLDEPVDVLLVGRNCSPPVRAPELEEVRRLMPWVCLLRSDGGDPPDPGTGGAPLETVRAPGGAVAAEQVVAELNAALLAARRRLFQFIETTSLHDSPELRLVNRIMDVAFDKSDHVGLASELVAGMMEIPGVDMVGILVHKNPTGWIALLHSRDPRPAGVFDHLKEHLLERAEQFTGRKVEKEELELRHSGGGVADGETVGKCSWMPVPVATAEEVFGVMLVEAGGGGLNIVEKLPFLYQAAHALANAMKGLEQMQELLIREPLTGCYNRRFMEEELNRLATLAEEKGQPFSMMLLDIDYFKQLNDAYGHRVGDECLQHIVRRLRGLTRPGDSLIRWGGDEFLLLFPDTGEEGARTFARRIHEEVRNDSRAAGSRNRKITLSSGVLTQPGGLRPYRRHELLEKVDRALYESKRKGRDQFTVWSEVPDKSLGQQPLLRRGADRDDPELGGESLGREYQFALDALIAILDAREFETALHSKRVAKLVTYLLRKLGVTGREYRDVVHGAILHDIGKIAIPDHILHKNGPLTTHEWQIMRRHPEIGYRFIQSGPMFKKAGEIILYHHENFDGGGYPRGLRGEEIPLGVRIFSPVDVYDAMRSNRVYKDPMSRERATEEIRVNAGTQFDPRVVEVFLEVIPELENIGLWES